MAVFEGKKSSNDIISNDLISDDEVVASYVPLRYLFLKGGGKRRRLPGMRVHVEGHSTCTCSRASREGSGNCAPNFSLHKKLK